MDTTRKCPVKVTDRKQYTKKSNGNSNTSFHLSRK